MVSLIPKIKLNNGHLIPVLGLGTWNSKPGHVMTAVKQAIQLGYRHIDCARFYNNEKEIGVALNSQFSNKKVGRGDLFITSKLWNTDHRSVDVEPAIKMSLEDLRLSYLDLYLIHWPMAYKPGKHFLPKDKKTGKIAYSKIDYVETWKAMEELVKKGLTKSIGVANFNKRQLSRILENCCVVPVINQVECHPYLNQCKLMEFCRCKNIAITCYSPLGSPSRPWAKEGEPVLLEDKRVKEISQKLGKSPAQILLRYQIERGNIVIPKTVNKKRLLQNMCIFDFSLDASTMECLDSLNIPKRYVELKGDDKHVDHPFVNDEY